MLKILMLLTSLHTKLFTEVNLLAALLCWGPRHELYLAGHQALFPCCIDTSSQLFLGPGSEGWVMCQSRGHCSPGWGWSGERPAEDRSSAGIMSQSREREEMRWEVEKRGEVGERKEKKEER